MLRLFGPASLENTHGQAQASLDGGDVTAVFVQLWRKMNSLFTFLMMSA